MVRGETKSVRITLEAAEDGVLGYVYLREIGRGGVAKTVQVVPGLIHADYDDQGRILGVEFLNAQEMDLPRMRDLAARLHAPELAGIDLAEMCKANV